jgi:hypothetical protein
MNQIEDIIMVQEDTNMDLAYQAAGQFLAAQKKINILLAQKFDELKELKPIVVPGQHDHIERILRVMKIPYETKRLLDLSTLPPLHNRPIFINCSSIHSPPRSLTERLKDHVAQGGTLITTDWALTLTNAIFPEYISWNQQHTAGHNESFSITQENAKPDDPTLSWFIENSSYPIALPMHEEVNVILKSLEFGKKYGGNPALGVAFPFGKGGVVHYVSHLYAQMVALHKDQDCTLSVEWAAKKGVDLGELGTQTSTGSVATAYDAMTTILGSTSRWKPNAATQKRAYIATVIPDVQTPVKPSDPFYLKTTGEVELEQLVQGLPAAYTIGRDTDACLFIPDSRVSRYHAVLEPTTEGVVIRDLQSKNGTYVNKALIEKPMALYFGDTIKVGKTKLEIVPAREVG